MGNFEGEECPIVKYKDTVQSSVQKRLGAHRIVLDGSSDPHAKGQFWGKGAPIVKYRDFLL